MGRKADVKTSHDVKEFGGVVQPPIFCRPNDLSKGLVALQRYSAAMSGSYLFSVDPWRDLLAISFTGFFRLEDLAGYVTAKNEAMARLTCGPNAHVTLCDFSSCIPQSQAVLDVFQTSLDDPVSRSRRLAVVVSSAIGSMQAQRIVTRADAAVFQDTAKARIWLMRQPCANGGSLTQ